MKELRGKWKFSKKRGVWIMKWKMRKIHGPVQLQQREEN